MATRSKNTWLCGDRSTNAPQRRSRARPPGGSSRFHRWKPIEGCSSELVKLHGHGAMNAYIQRCNFIVPNQYFSIKDTNVFVCICSLPSCHILPYLAISCHILPYLAIFQDITWSLTSFHIASMSQVAMAKQCPLCLAGGLSELILSFDPNFSCKLTEPSQTCFHTISESRWGAFICLRIHWEKYETLWRSKKRFLSLNVSVDVSSCTDRTLYNWYKYILTLRKGIPSHYDTAITRVAKLHSSGEYLVVEPANHDRNGHVYT